MTEQLANIENNTPVTATEKPKRKYVRKKNAAEKITESEITQLTELVLALKQQVAELSSPHTNIPAHPTANPAITTQNHTDDVLRATKEEDEPSSTRRSTGLVRRARNDDRPGDVEARRQAISLGNRPNRFEEITKDKKFKQDVEKDYKAARIEPKYVVPPVPRDRESLSVKIECLGCGKIDTIPENLIPPYNRYRCASCVPRK
jgi:hypothetical protein